MSNLKKLMAIISALGLMVFTAGCIPDGGGGGNKNGIGDGITFFSVTGTDLLEAVGVPGPSEIRTVVSPRQSDGKFKINFDIGTNNKVIAAFHLSEDGVYSGDQTDELLFSLNCNDEIAGASCESSNELTCQRTGSSLTCKGGGHTSTANLGDYFNRKGEGPVNLLLRVYTIGSMNADFSFDTVEDVGTVPIFLY